MTAASFFSLSIKASTESTIIPAFLTSGSSTFKNVFLGLRSIPRVDASTVSNGFFFA